MLVLKILRNKLKIILNFSINNKSINYIFYKNNIKHKNIKKIDFYKDNFINKNNTKFIEINDEQKQFILNNKNENIVIKQDFWNYIL